MFALPLALAVATPTPGAVASSGSTAGQAGLEAGLQIEPGFDEANAAFLAARYQLPPGFEAGGDSSCDFEPGVEFTAHQGPPKTMLVPSTVEAPGLCCAACDQNASCVSWTLQWNQYSSEPNRYSSTCFLWEDVAQDWAVSRATPPFSCGPGSFGGAAHCVNYTWSRGGDAVSGRKRRRSPVLPPPPENQTVPVPTKAGLPNILYLVADDMRPQLATYGHNYMITPNLDRLAATGLQFDFAYTQFAYCAPSRNSFMSGRRPDRTQALNFMTTFRTRPGGQDWVSMPQFFKDHGYFTSSGGKVYHDGMDDAMSWTFPSKQTAWVSCQGGEHTYVSPYGGTDVMPGNETRQDPSPNAACTITANTTNPQNNENISLGLGLARMDLAHASGRPWWVSIGVHRPHAPYRSPAGFEAEKLYPGGVVNGPVFPQTPMDSPYMAGNWQGEDITNVYGVGSPDIIVNPNITIELRRYYYAAVTWSDHMLGKAIDKLDALGVADQTIVVFHSDHGYQLGELNQWSKKTNTELATHVPLIVRVPWLKNAVGKRTAVRAELVDVYRTLADLAGLLLDVQPNVQGASLAPLFKDPEHPPVDLAAKPAFSQIARCACQTYVCWGSLACPGKASGWNNSWYMPGGGTRGCNALPAPRADLQCFSCRNNSRHAKGTPPPPPLPPQCGWSGTECGANACAKTPQSSFDFMGYTMRTDTRRFTAWVSWDKSQNTTDWAKPVEHELFDLTGDTGRSFDFPGYSLNLAKLPQYRDEVQILHAELEAAVATWA